MSFESLVYICKVVGIYQNDFGQMVLSSETLGFKSCDFDQEFNSSWMQLLKMQKLKVVQLKLRQLKWCLIIFYDLTLDGYICIYSQVPAISVYISLYMQYRALWRRGLVFKCSESYRCYICTYSTLFANRDKNSKIMISWCMVFAII